VIPTNEQIQAATILGGRESTVTVAEGDGFQRAAKNFYPARTKDEEWFRNYLSSGRRQSTGTYLRRRCYPTGM
jgi:hypothetical protein